MFFFITMFINAAKPATNLYKKQNQIKVETNVICLWIRSSSSHLIPYSLAKTFLAMALASNIGGKIEKDDVLSTVDKRVSLSLKKTYA